MTTHDSEMLLDAVARLTAGLVEDAQTEDLARLRQAAATALRLDLARGRELPSAGRFASGLSIGVDDDLRAAVAADLRRVDERDETPLPVVAISRDYELERLLSSDLSGPTGALTVGERRGPFVLPGDDEMWFDLFFAAEHLEVGEVGASAPALVLTSAQPPAAGGDPLFELKAGTVWIRGDLVADSLPTGAYVGIVIDAGTLRVRGPVSMTGDTITVPGTLHAELKLRLAERDPEPIDAGCDSAQASVTLPDALSCVIDAGAAQLAAAPGEATAWGQTFSFSSSTGSWRFVAPQWTVVLDCEVDGDRFDADAIPSALCTFEGPAKIRASGLGLPVVVVDPDALGEATRGAGWWLLLESLGARWYDADPRPHALLDAWVGISGQGAIIRADEASGLDAPVTDAFSLWAIAGGGEQRLPWRLVYDRAFSLSYRCERSSVEELVVVGGRADFRLDRPVRSNGAAVVSSADRGVMQLHDADGHVTVRLASAATAGGDPDEQVLQLALRNALLWTTPVRGLSATGPLTGPRSLQSGAAFVLAGVYAWAPTLPDPYVANATIRRPDIRPGGPLDAVLVTHATWTAPAGVTIAFEGQLDTQIAATPLEPSEGEPRPAAGGRREAQVGDTQTRQGRLTHPPQELRAWQRAVALEAEVREERIRRAEHNDNRVMRAVGRHLSELLGPAPGLLLLDVSTNQDLLGVALGRGRRGGDDSGTFSIADTAVHVRVDGLRVVTLPQVQWEPVRTLDTDQDIVTLGWFPTPLASATDGGPTQIGARSQRLAPAIPEDALRGTHDAYADGTPVAFRTTLPFGLIAVVGLQPKDVGPRRADRYELTRPRFPDADAVGGLQATAIAEGGRPDNGGVSPAFEGRMGQLANGVDLETGQPRGLSVLGSTADPGGSVEATFNDNMAAHPRVPVTRFDLSGYGGSNFSDWNNPFAAFAATAKVQFRIMVGRTALEIIKVNSVLHPWGIRVTRSVTVERRPGGGVIRRDSGWQAFTAGLFDYRYFDVPTNAVAVAGYRFDAGVFRGLFDVRAIRPAPGAGFSDGGSTMIPYYFDADVALEGRPQRDPALGMLGFLQTLPSDAPAPAAALQALIDAQGPIGGPIDVTLDLGGSGLPFRVRRLEVGVALDGSDPVFVATLRGVPRLPRTGAWSVVSRPVGTGDGEAVPVAEGRGVPLIRRYPVRYPASSTATFSEPPLDGPPSAAGDYRLADAADLLTPAAPANDYALLQSAPTHAFLFPRPSVPAGGGPVIESTARPALADIVARSTSKGAFPPPANTIELAPGALHFDVGPGGTLALSGPVDVVGHPTPLRIAGGTGHGTVLAYDQSTLHLELLADRWSAEFTGLRIWTDITGIERLTGAELRIVGSTEQRPQIAEIRSLLLQDVEDILSYIPLVGERGVQGPIDLGAANAKREVKVEAQVKQVIPPLSKTPVPGIDLHLTLRVRQSTGFDLATGGAKASATFGAELEGKLTPFGVVGVFVIVSGKVEFTIVSVSGTVTAEKLELTLFAGIGVRGDIGPFTAYAFLGIGIVLNYDAVARITKYGGLVALEAGIDLHVVEITVRAELKGLAYEDAGATKCDYTGSVKVEVDLFLIFSISASYTVTDTVVLGA